MEDFISAIANVGFPIVITLYLLVRIENKMEKLDGSINNLSSSINNLNRVEK